MWPDVFQLNCGESYTLNTRIGQRTVTLLQVEELYQPDYWTRENPSHQVLERAVVKVDVSGVQATLILRPFEMPRIVNGLRIYVEATKNWALDCERPQLHHVTKDVRFSALDAARPWGPDDLVFPLLNYRWHASSYGNTWSSIVAYNRVYYHRGEDYGAIPDCLDVVAMMQGTVICSPFDDDGCNYGSNPVHILHPSGHFTSYAHMNLKMLDPQLRKGRQIEAGQVLGKTGGTWAGRLVPLGYHLHVSLHEGDATLPDYRLQADTFSLYPMLIDAYFRMYPDTVLPVAGRYYWTTSGQPIELDASRSLARPGHSIRGYRWKLPDGTVVEDEKVTLSYEKPSLYTAELTVYGDDGSEDRDFAQIRVYHPEQNRELAYGWLHYTPVRGIIPGYPVIFWNRFTNTVGDVLIDFGDGSQKRAIDHEITHMFDNPGVYTVTLSGQDRFDNKVETKVRVIVEQAK